MLNTIVPKLPMRNKEATIAFYVDGLGFQLHSDYGDYLIISKDAIEIHFFLFSELEPSTNYGQVYIRTSHIDALYHLLISKEVQLHPNGSLEAKPWGQKEFSLLDPDKNLLTFGQEN